MLKFLFTFSFVSLILTQFHTFSTENDTINCIKKKNLVEIQPTDFLFLRAGISYERMLNKSLSLRIPIQLSVGDYHNNERILNSAGIQLLFFPLEHKVVSYFAGISVKGGNFEINRYGFFDCFTPLPYPTSKKHLFILPEIMNGIRINLSKHFSLSYSLSLGFIKIKDFEAFEFKSTGYFGMGFKF